MYFKKDNVVSLNSVASIPPQNIEAEEAILGGILLDPGAIARIVDSLQPEAFYVSTHQDIYRAALTLHNLGQPTDFMTVTSWLYDHRLLDRVGGQSKIAQLLESTVSAVNIDRYAALVMDKYLRRQLIQSGNEITQLGYDSAMELDEVLEQSEQKIFALTNQGLIEVEPPIDIIARICNKFSDKEVGLDTGIYDLNKLIGGLKKQKLYVIAGRSGMGKTQLAVWLAHAALIKQKPVVFFSAEMTRDELMCRLLACDSGVDSKVIEEGNELAIDFNAFYGSAERLGNVPLWLDDTPGSFLSITKIRAGIRRATAHYGQPALVILDYLQLLGDESGKSNRVTELDRIANGCKSVAKEFDIPFVTLAQINRSVESQSNKRPSISSLRESGGLEQAADAILLLYRDDYYNSDSEENGTIEIIVGKQRSGATGTVKCLFKPEVSQFLNLT